MRGEFGALFKSCISDPLPWGEEEIRGFKETPAPPPWFLLRGFAGVTTSFLSWVGGTCGNNDSQCGFYGCWSFQAGWYLPFQLDARAGNVLQTCWPRHSCAKAAFGVCCGVLDNWSPVCYFKFSSMKYWVGKCDGWQRSCTELLLFPTCSNPWSSTGKCKQSTPRVSGSSVMLWKGWWLLPDFPSLWLVFVMKFSVHWIYHVYSVASFRSQRVNSWWAFPRDGQKLESSCLHFFQIQCADNFLGWFSLNRVSQL